MEPFAAYSACEAPQETKADPNDGHNAALKSPPMSRLSMNQVTTNRWSFLDDLLAFRAEGFDAAGLWRPKVAEFGEERAIELVHDLGLSISSLSWAGGFTGSNGSSFFDAIDDARRSIHLAGRLGAECLVLVSGSKTRHIGSHAKRLLVDAIKALSDDAAERHVTLALQPMHPRFSRQSSFLQSLDETLEIIDRSGRGARIAFDVFHLWREPRLMEWIPEIASSVAVVQLSDCREWPCSEYDRCIPGDGQIPLESITRAFDEAGYAGYYEICIWSDEIWRSNYFELLRMCRTRFDLLCRRDLPLQAAQP